MNTSSLFRYTLILQTSSLQAPDRNRLDHHSHIEFILLCVATGIVGLGIFFEWPEVKEDIQAWWQSRPSKRRSWMIGPSPGRSSVPLWSLIGFLLVAGGVAAEGLFETLVGMNDTEIRQMDEASIAADELQIAQLQQQNLKLQKQAGDAATSAYNAAVDAGKAKTDAGDAKTLASGARTEADSFENDIKSAKQNAADAESHLAEALKEAAGAKMELNLLTTPRILVPAPAFANTLRQFAGTEYTFAMVSQDQDSVTLLREIDSALQLAGWKRVKPSPTPFIGAQFDDLEKGFLVALGTQVGVVVEVDSTESVESLRSMSSENWPPLVRTAAMLKNSLAVVIIPADNVQKDVVIHKGSSPTIQIAVGSKVTSNAQ